MTWMESLAQLKILGYSFYRGPDTIKYKYFGQSKPEGTKVQPLLKILAENKAEVLSALKEEPSQNEKSPDEERILGMDLMNFGESGAMIKIWSDLLKREVWLVPGDSDKTRVPNGETSYTAAELEFLVNQNPGPQGLTLIDKMKELFTGARVVCIRTQDGGDGGLTPQLNLTNQLTRT